MKKVSLEQELKGNAYPGRGIVIGRSKDGTKAVAGYFIMGRSQNSRNRVFVEEGEGIRTQAFDPSKLEDPSLIIYAPVRVLGNDTIVTNGDQTDTVYEGLEQGKTFEVSLRSREFEPDSPTPFFHVSAIFLTTPENRIDPSCPVTRNRNGRSSTKSISSSGISAAVSEMPSSVYAAPVTPFSSISSVAA